jgi:hypothetical protein
VLCGLLVIEYAARRGKKLLCAGRMVIKKFQLATQFSGCFSLERPEK